MIGQYSVAIYKVILGFWRWGKNTPDDVTFEDSHKLWSLRKGKIKSPYRTKMSPNSANAPSFLFAQHISKDFIQRFFFLLWDTFVKTTKQILRLM